MEKTKRSLWRSKWLYIVVAALLIVALSFVAGLWIADSGERSVSAVVDSYTAVYAGSDSTKDVADLVPLYAENGVLRDVATDRTYEGLVEIRAALDALLSTAGFDLTVEKTLIGDDWALIQWTADGTETTSGRLAQVGGTTLLEIAEEKIIRETWYYDPAKAPF
ncbi:MAG: nuclear transport factor 2 family protein [Coriobacteriia bacterium]|nr:nuclear transport factor 2 family protein [Coriobacteriia bacterium]